MVFRQQRKQTQVRHTVAKVLYCDASKAFVFVCFYLLLLYRVTQSQPAKLQRRILWFIPWDKLYGEGWSILKPPMLQDFLEILTSEHL